MAYSHTKKVGHMGRYGCRMGAKLRKILNEIEDIQRQKHICPRCGKKKVVRISAGIWRCRSCNLKFAGGTFAPTAIELKGEK
ncbi:MAG: 50S ribosomal protein L37ae [Candidatus Altarchaeaceae archaeon]